MTTTDVLRSILGGAPGDSPGEADAMCFDLPISGDLVAEASERPLRLVRPRFARLEYDIEAAPWDFASAVCIPGVDGPAIVERVNHHIDLVETTLPAPRPRLGLVAYLASARGVAHVEQVCATSLRLIAVVFDGPAFIESVGAVRTRGGTELSLARARVAAAAAAVGVAAIDGPEPDTRDLFQFERDALAAHALGFSGKWCLHPHQVEIANRVFGAQGVAPTAREHTGRE